MGPGIGFHGAIGVVAAKARTQDPGADECRDASGQVDDGGAGEIEEVEFREPAPTPGPVATTGYTKAEMMNE